VRPRRRVRINRRTQCLIAVLLAVFPIAYGLFALHLGQDIGFDTLNYHYFDPYWLLSDHFHDILPAQEQTYLSPLLNVPTYLLQRSLSARGASFIIAAVEGTAVIPLYFIARRVTSTRAVALVLAVLGMFGAIAWSEIGTSFGDNLVAIPLLSSIALIGRYRASSNDGQNANGWLLIAAGVASGIGGGLKLAEAPITLGFLVAIPLLHDTARGRILGSLKYLGGAIVGAGIAYGYWAYEMVSRFGGDPFLPFFNNIFHSQFAPASRNTDNRFLPHDLLQFLFYPIVWTLHPLHSEEIDFRELSLPICEILLLIAIATRLYRLARNRSWQPLFAGDFERFIVVGSCISILIWEDVFGIYRYLTMIEMLSFVLLWILTRSVLAGLPALSLNNRALAVAIVVLCAVCVATEQPANFGRSGFAAKYFAVSVPKPLRRSNNTILMLGTEPYAYVIPFLPQSTDVMRLQGSLLPTPYVAGLIAKRLKHASSSSVFIIWMSVERRAQFLQDNAFEWTNYGLELVAKSCSAFKTGRGAERAWVRYCRLAPSTTSTAAAA
jgi:hypothetical protein